MMSHLHLILPPKLYENIERAGINTAKQILVLSVWEIKKKTNLSTQDIKLIKSYVANEMSPSSILTSKRILHERNINTKVTTGCSEINSVLEGGYRIGTITEIFGESGTGKTQLGIQAALHNWPKSVLYICTEDLFPIKRLNEIKRCVPNYDPNVDYGKNIFVEHIIEARDLLSCIQVRSPKLLSQHRFSLIIIDSIAAPFRVDNSNYVQRAEELRELSMALINFSQQYKLAVLCINQVTASFNNSDNMLPSLGLAWSNMVSTRLWVRKTMKTIDVNKIKAFESEICNDKILVKELIVTFAPDLANDKVQYVITDRGIKGIT
ncbi:DNA repair protein XRCC3 [Manduca sexta]|uniref:DNA repair protein XRCC3 n=1 Tax=Manduca sexta TaxID=7130 RepID=UPI00188E809F|nr:DNA repair protein XRCC3 [Manduca sexta]